MALPWLSAVKGNKLTVADWGMWNLWFAEIVMGKFTHFTMCVAIMHHFLLMGAVKRPVLFALTM